MNPVVLEESLVLERPLIVFDLEMTGIDPGESRVIQFAGGKIFPRWVKGREGIRHQPNSADTSRGH